MIRFYFFNTYFGFASKPEYFFDPIDFEVAWWRLRLYHNHASGRNEATEKRASYERRSTHRLRKIFESHRGEPIAGERRASKTQDDSTTNKPCSVADLMEEMVSL